MVAFVKDNELDELMQSATDAIYEQGFILSIGKWSNDAAKRVAERTGVDEANLPVIRVLKAKGRDLAKYAFEEYFEELTPENLKQFA